MQNQLRLGSIWCKLVLLAAIVAGASSALWAQGTAYLTGYVLDPSQAGVPNATIEIKNDVTGAVVSIKTTDAGVYRSPAVDPGTYTITAGATGFQTSVTTGIVVELGQPRGVDVHLVLGQQQQRVEVTAAAPLLRTEDSGLGQSISYSEVSKLPYFSRSAGALLGLSPGVRYGGEDSISYGASRYNVAGWTNVNVMVDGAPVNGDRTDVAQMTLNPSVESLSEVRVVTNQYSAEFGADVGALVLMESKSGSNQWHGSGYEYLRNEFFDTDNHFSGTRPIDRQNNFGGTFGGPILRNKLFFFTAQEGAYLKSPQGVVLTVPTAAMKAGDFSGLPAIYDPASTTCAGTNCTRTQFSGNQIPVGNFDPVAVNLLQYFPDPNQPGDVNNLTASTGLNNHRYRGTVKVDWNIGAKDTLAAVWNMDRVTQINLGVPAYNAIDPAASPTFGGFGFQYQTQIYNFSETHLFSPNTFMTNRVIWRPRYITRLNPAVNPAAMYAETLGIKNYSGALMPESFGGDLGFPTFNFAGYTGLGPGLLLFQENPINEFDYQGSISLVRGSHAIKAGFQIERGEHGAPDQTTPTGSFNFGALETSQPGAAGTGNAFASFLLGQVDQGSTELGPPLTWKNVYVAPWIQDDWKVSHRLTVNLGLRWDIDFPVTEEKNRGNAFNPTEINPVSGTPGIYEFLGVNGWPSNFYNTDWHRFAPRIGFAYQLTDKTVIRGGYGMYGISPILGANRRAPSDGFTTNAAFNSPDSGITPAFILSSGFPTYPLGGDPSILNSSFGSVPVGSTPVASPTFVERNWKFGYAENFNLSVQRELSNTMVIEVAGQGSLGRKLPYGQNINEVDPSQWGLTGSNFSRRPFPQFNNVTDVKYPEGSMDYYAGYIRFNKRFGSGLNLIANYNWGKSIGFFGGSIYFPKLSRQLGIYDTANGATGMPIHQATVSFTYAFPFGRGRTYFNQGLAANLLGGWDIGGIFTVHSGVPFNITSGSDSLNGNSPLGNRVDLVGNPTPSDQNPSHYLDASAFAAPTFGTIGNFCCTRLSSPANALLNMNLGKSFVVHEGFNIRLIAEVFNLLNSPQWGVPDTNLTDPGFGTITGSGSGAGSGVANPQDGARVMQMGIRLDF
jgi:hypothetical protein